MNTSFLILGGFILFIALLLIVFFISRYRRCPSDKILVVYGKTGGEQSAKCYAGGAAFVWPVIQDYRYLDLQPIPIDVNLTDALSKQNIRVSVPSQFTVGVSNKPNLMINAAERLLGLEGPAIRSLAHDIIMGQMRLVIANMDIEELNTDRDKFVDSVYTNVGNELHKIGLELINVNVTDIQDESGYIQALGKEAAAKAINDAKVKVANETRVGAVGQAEAEQEQRTKVADANSKAEIGEAKADQEQRIQIASANSAAEIGEATAQSAAVEGKNTEAIKIAKSNAQKQVQEAKALEESYAAETLAETARGKMELAKKQASEVVDAEIEKKKAVISAQADAEKEREAAKGKADAALAIATAKAKGIALIAKAEADGIQQQSEAAGGAENLVMLKLADNAVEIVKEQAEALKTIQFGEITVIGEGGAAGGFLNGLGRNLMGFDKILSQVPMGDELKKKFLPEATTKTDESTVLETTEAKTSASADQGAETKESSKTTDS